MDETNKPKKGDLELTPFSGGLILALSLAFIVMPFYLVMHRTEFTMGITLWLAGATSLWISILLFFYIIYGALKLWGKMSGGLSQNIMITVPSLALVCALVASKFIDTSEAAKILSEQAESNGFKAVALGNAIKSLGVNELWSSSPTMFLWLTSYVLKAWPAVVVGTLVCTLLVWTGRKSFLQKEFPGWLNTLLFLLMVMYGISSIILITSI